MLSRHCVKACAFVCHCDDLLANLHSRGYIGSHNDQLLKFVLLPLYFLRADTVISRQSNGGGYLYFILYV